MHHGSEGIVIRRLRGEHLIAESKRFLDLLHANEGQSLESLKVTVRHDVETRHKDQTARLDQLILRTLLQKFVAC